MKRKRKRSFFLENVKILQKCGWTPCRISGIMSYCRVKWGQVKRSENSGLPWCYISIIRNKYGNFSNCTENLPQNFAFHLVWVELMFFENIFCLAFPLTILVALYTCKKFRKNLLPDFYKKKKLPYIETNKK